VYIRPTVCSPQIRHKAHIKKTEYNKQYSGYPRHILHNIHQYGRIKDIMGKNRQGKKKPK
jgi:hypothetical protein